jgi:CDP-4-dehydro-6-deoxyglucose reductase
VFEEMKERAIIRFEGPLGTFYLREDSDKPMIFVAGGTGFAPIKAIVEHAFHHGEDRPIVLYWGVRSLRDLYMPDLPLQWQRDHPNFTYIPVLSDPLPEDQWQGRTGFVHQAVLDDFPDLAGYQVYACGAPAMTDVAKKTFVEQRRLPEDEFYCDAFTPSVDAKK